MYRSCIFCSAALGANEALEGFPVGRTIAFDAAKGRLWVVCPRCARWNLAAVEERWEPIEHAERAFRDVRLRVHSENVGMAALADGTCLVRVGAALPGELAAWRYGDKLELRRKRYLAGVAGLAGAAALIAGAGALGAVGGAAAVQLLTKLGGYGWILYVHDEIETFPPGRLHPRLPMAVRASDLSRGRLTQRDGEIGLQVPLETWVRGRNGEESAKVVIHDFDASETALLLQRGMVFVNRRGGGGSRLRSALAHLEGSGSAGAFLRQCALRNQRILEGGRRSAQGRARALAMEMALHEEVERRSLEGELTALTAAWREAEEIAGIADRLPDLPAPEPPELGSR